MLKDSTLAVLNGDTSKGVGSNSNSKNLKPVHHQPMFSFSGFDEIANSENINSLQLAAATRCSDKKQVTYQEYQPTVKQPQIIIVAATAVSGEVQQQVDLKSAEYVSGQTPGIGLTASASDSSLKSWQNSSGSRSDKRNGALGHINSSSESKKLKKLPNGVERDSAYDVPGNSNEGDLVSTRAFCMQDVINGFGGGAGSAPSSQSIANTARESRSLYSNRVQEQIREASKSLEAYRTRSQKLHEKQSEIKNEERGLEQKERRLEEEMGKFNLNSKELQEYSSQMQKDLRRHALLSQSQSQSATSFAHAITQVVSVQEQLVEMQWQAKCKEITMQLAFKSELIVKLENRIREIEEGRLAERNQSEQAALIIAGERESERNRFLALIRDKEVIEADLRIQLANVMQNNNAAAAATTMIAATINTHGVCKCGGSLPQNSSMELSYSKDQQATVYLQRIETLEKTIQEKCLQESSLIARVLDLEHELKKVFPNKSISTKSQILQSIAPLPPRIQLTNASTCSNSNTTQLGIMNFASVQSPTTTSRKRNRTCEIGSEQHLNTSSSSQISRMVSPPPLPQSSSCLNGSIGIANNPMHASVSMTTLPDSNSFSCIGRANTSSLLSDQQTQQPLKQQGISRMEKLEKDSQMHSVLNELKLYDEQASKQTLSQIKLKTSTGITPISASTPAAGGLTNKSYTSRDASVDFSSAEYLFHQHHHGSSATPSSILNTQASNNNSLSSCMPTGICGSGGSISIPSTGSASASSRMNVKLPLANHPTSSSSTDQQIVRIVSKSPMHLLNHSTQSAPSNHRSNSSSTSICNTSLNSSQYLHVNSNSLNNSTAGNPNNSSNSVASQQSQSSQQQNMINRMNRQQSYLLRMSPNQVGVIEVNQQQVPPRQTNSLPKPVVLLKQNATLVTTTTMTTTTTTTTKKLLPKPHAIMSPSSIVPAVPPTTTKINTANLQSSGQQHIAQHNKSIHNTNAN